MTREQMIAWLTLEGWEPRWFSTEAATLTNGTHWIGHMTYHKIPIDRHPNANRPSKPAKWSDVIPSYFYEAWLVISGEQK